MNDLTSYLEFSNTRSISDDDVVTLRGQDTVLRFSENQTEEGTYIVRFSGYSLNKNSNDFLKTISYSSEFYKVQKQKDLLLEAFKNHRTQVRFLQLNLLLEQKQISEKEYDEIIDENENDYFIPYPNKKPTEELFFYLCELIESINDKELSVNEVSELFSLDLSEIEKKLLELK